MASGTDPFKGTCPPHCRTPSSVIKMAVPPGGGNRHRQAGGKKCIPKSWSKKMRRCVPLGTRVARNVGASLSAPSICCQHVSLSETTSSLKFVASKIPLPPPRIVIVAVRIQLKGRGSSLGEKIGGHWVTAIGYLVSSLSNPWLGGRKMRSLQGGGVTQGGDGHKQSGENVGHSKSWSEKKNAVTRGGLG